MPLITTNVNPFYTLIKFLADQEDALLRFFTQSGITLDWRLFKNTENRYYLLDLPVTSTSVLTLDGSNYNIINHHITLPETSIVFSNKQKTKTSLLHYTAEMRHEAQGKNYVFHSYYQKDFTACCAQHFSELSTDEEIVQNEQAYNFESNRFVTPLAELAITAFDSLIVGLKEKLSTKIQECDLASQRFFALINRPTPLKDENLSDCFLEFEHTYLEIRETYPTDLPVFSEQKSFINLLGSVFSEAQSLLTQEIEDIELTNIHPAVKDNDPRTTSSQKSKGNKHTQKAASPVPSLAHSPISVAQFFSAQTEEPLVAKNSKKGENNSHIKKTTLDKFNAAQTRCHMLFNTAKESLVTFTKQKDSSFRLAKEQIKKIERNIQELTEELFLLQQETPKELGAKVEEFHTALTAAITVWAQEKTHLIGEYLTDKITALICPSPSKAQNADYCSLLKSYGYQLTVEQISRILNRIINNNLSLIQPVIDHCEIPVGEHLSLDPTISFELMHLFTEAFNIIHEKTKKESRLILSLQIIFSSLTLQEIDKSSNSEFKGLRTEILEYRSALEAQLNSPICLSQNSKQAAQSNMKGKSKK